MIKFGLEWKIHMSPTGTPEPAGSKALAAMTDWHVLGPAEADMRPQIMATNTNLITDTGVGAGFNGGRNQAVVPPVKLGLWLVAVARDST